ncbi:MAG: RNA helicase, partial [Thiobacillus sp.]
AQRVWGNRIPQEEPVAKPDVDGNSVEYWARREREAKAQAKAKPAARSYGGRFDNRSAGGGNRGAAAHDNRGGARTGVRGRFKD